VRQGSVPQRLAGPLVLHGTSPLVDALLATMPSCVYSAQYATGPIDAFALWANEAHARCVVSIIESPVPGIGLHYWSGYQSFSQEGERLASSLAAALSNTTISQRLSVSGMALPILRETQMTSLHVEHGPLGDDEANTITAVIAETLGNFFHSHN
jgi:N-acetylmuramoyl-L-alanine amidase